MIYKLSKTKNCTFWGFFSGKKASSFGIFCQNWYWVTGLEFDASDFKPDFTLFCFLGSYYDSPYGCFVLCDVFYNASDIFRGLYLYTVEQLRFKRSIQSLTVGSECNRKYSSTCVLTDGRPPLVQLPSATLKERS